MNTDIVLSTDMTDLLGFFKSQGGMVSGRAWQVFQNICSQMGFDNLVVASLSNFTGLSAPYSFDLKTSYPFEWLAHYQNAGHAVIDPVVKNGLITQIPFTWSEVVPIDNAAHAVMGEAKEFGLQSGASIPYVSVTYGQIGMSVASSYMTQAEVDQVWPYVRGDLLILFTALMESLSPLTTGDSNTVSISSREKECLLWAARGKSAWETGEILNISQETVRHHLKSAMHKLNATGKTEAVVKALSKNLIVL